MPAPTEPLVLIADPGQVAEGPLPDALREAGYRVAIAAKGQDALNVFYGEPPQCVLVRHGLEARLGRSLLAEIKGDHAYGHVPVILLATQGEVAAGIDWEQVPADDYVIEPAPPATVLSRIRICWARARRDIHANPLTGLPGNLTIALEAERRLDAGIPFAIAYADLDAFKAYNDKYGFSRGDEVLRMTSRILVNATRSLGSDDTYVGHIGGDDFVFITPPELMARACEAIGAHFDAIVRSFYDEEDRAEGRILSKDRQGNPCTFPLMSCSIGVVDTSQSKVSHIGELVSRATEMKSAAKGSPGSNYKVDHRH